LVSWSVGQLKIHASPWRGIAIGKSIKIVHYGALFAFFSNKCYTFAVLIIKKIEKMNVKQKLSVAVIAIAALTGCEGK